MIGQLQVFVRDDDEKEEIFLQMASQLWQNIFSHYIHRVSFAPIF